MKVPILTAVLLGLVLTPALGGHLQQTGDNCHVCTGGVFQNLTLSSQTRVAIFEQRSNQLSWKTIWNYNTGVIATKVLQENTCYISVMNRTEMPSFDTLVRLAAENRNQMGQGRPTRKITFVTRGLVSNLNTYGSDIIAMCSGVITYQAVEVHGPQVNLGPCVTLNVFRVAQLKYCNSNFKPDQPQQDDNQQVIIGGQSQIVTIHTQWRVAVIEQTTSTGSWKTIWNYNTGVIATKVIQENTCYISIMNRAEMPSFDNLPRLARESRNQMGLGRLTRKITFVTNGLVNNLNSYGSNIVAMCSGVPTYHASEVQGPQVNLGPCVTLNVLRVVQLKYCSSNGLPDQPQQDDNQQVIIGGQSQIVTIHTQWRVAVIEQTTSTGSWKTIWNYNTGVIATKVLQENTCYISIMNRAEMPSFDNLPRLARESRNQMGHGRLTRKITFVTNGLVNNLNSYGSNIVAMCSGVPTYHASEVQGPQVNLGPCVTLNVLRVVQLKYCSSNGLPDQPQQDDHQQVIIGGQSQIVTIHTQWRVAVIEQTTSTGSWKTIWNYNTGVIATKVIQENTCYISIMNRAEMPSFDNLPRLARESRNQMGHGRLTRKITFVTNGLVNNLNSYGSNIVAMCSGVPTYHASEVQGPQVNLGPCVTLNVLRVVQLKYCSSNGLPDQPQQDDHQQVIIGGQSQIVTIHTQWRVAVIEQTTSTGSWKTIWNYNTGVIATKVIQENTCYISIMNRAEMPSFDNLPRLARESRNQMGLGRLTRKITFVTNGLVNNLNSYGSNIVAMCSGVPTYHASEVQGPQVNLGPCVTLNVLRVVQLKYCSSNGLPDQPQQDDNQQVIIGGQSQIVTIHTQWRVAVIEQTTSTGSWKTIWNYNTGVIATKVMQENTCYISIMNRAEMPSFDNLPRLARESRNQMGHGRLTRKITFVTNGLVNNLNSYGSNIVAMCSGVPTYHASEVQGPQVNLGPCVTLNVLRVVELKYCSSNGLPDQPQQDDNQQVIIGGQSQIVTIHTQWRVAVIEQTTSTGSWKTIWNYNTGVIATKVMQENTCYISIMNRAEMPSFDNLPRLARESRNQMGHGRLTRKITFVTNGLVNNLNSYGSNIVAMCSGVPTYHASEVQGPQVNLGPCVTLNVLRVVQLKYCSSNGLPDQSHQSDDNCQVSVGGVFQNMTLSGQTLVAVIEQRSNQLSWKTIWNYNTGVIATKVIQENTCYISTMNKNKMPTFDALVRLAAENRNQIAQGRPTKKITFVAKGLVSNLNSYRADIRAMCRGVPTYQAYEAQGPQMNLGSCTTLDVMKVVDLNYCRGRIMA